MLFFRENITSSNSPLPCLEFIILHSNNNNDNGIIITIIVIFVISILGVIVIALVLSESLAIK